MTQKKRSGAARGLAALGACTLLAAGCGGGGGAGTTGAVPGAALVGSYGGAQVPAPGTPALLALTATGGALSLPCGSGGTLSAPLVPDSHGHAVAAGTFSLDLGPQRPVGITPAPATYTATVSGDQITLVLTTGTTTYTYTLTHGQTADLSSVPCPA